ncbi:MAG: tyrosine-type recombinase/integrase [Rubrivivax sp.]|nr:tyrosine-type recombinase/integrase [Rubrivivax sp.]
MQIKIPHAEYRRQRWYAVLDVPAEVQHVVGKARYLQSTLTGEPTEARRRVPVLIAQWKAEIAKARGTLPDPKDTFWQTLRKDHMQAQAEGNTGAQFVVEDLIRQALPPDPDTSSNLWKFATGLSTPLAPLVTGWKDSLTKLAKKTVDQAHRDVSRMADHFINVEALQPKRVKAWTDKLLADGMTASSFERIGNGCRSFWAYLQDAGVKEVLDPDPFAGPFRLATRRAVATDTGRGGNAYTPEQVEKLYLAAVAKQDQPLADLIALGAYTGARIGELCQITRETGKGGVFFIGTKTPKSKRFLPIHPAIVPLVARMFDASADGFLVPSAADNQYRNRSGPLGQRFGRLKKALGYGAAHVFHTMRGTLMTLLRHADVDPAVISAVAGHATGNFSLDKYTKGGSYAQQLKALGAVSYPGRLALGAL